MEAHDHELGGTALSKREKLETHIVASNKIITTLDWP